MKLQYDVIESATLMTAFYQESGLLFGVLGIGIRSDNIKCETNHSAKDSTKNVYLLNMLFILFWVFKYFRILLFVVLLLFC